MAHRHILVEINDSITAKVKVYFPCPVTLTWSYGANYRWLAKRNGVVTELRDESSAIEYFDQVNKEIDGQIPAKLVSVTFLQEKYKKKPFTISAADWKAIENAVSKASPEYFDNGLQLYHYCQPDYD